ncbi:hypothetical protein [Flavobacterium sp. SLB02]|uniref:hypothetical protein n=1 Tax=Flavobacterium sp. SLB02 TaxID=2665645 RepID=UPI0012A9D976|nr:hypothetical protein [Flavobacterium sp. SLB02]QGK75030.1 hypothetical protein GIY83_13405 [Flavobacterium sp. SLB02]
MEEETNQISIEFRYPYDYHYREASYFHHSMLMQDLSFDKFEHRKGLITFTLEAQDSNTILEEITNIFKLHPDTWRGNSTEVVLIELFLLIANELIRDGICCFEKNSSISNNTLVSIKLIDGNIKRKWNSLKQSVPKSIGNKSVKIPIDKCFILEFPHQICTTKQYSSVIKSIKEIDSKDSPMLSVLNPSKLSKIKGYDSITHHNYIELKTWGLTKDISWHHRSQFSQKEFFSSYYMTLRDLKFKKTKLLLMYHIFKFMENMIEEVFDDVKLKINYIKNIEDINLLIDNFEKGNFNLENYTQAIRDYP